MMELLWKVVAQLGTAAVVCAAIAYVAKHLFDHLLKRDLEHDRAALTLAAQTTLAELQGTLRGELERDLVSRKGEIDAYLARRREDAEQSLIALKARFDQDIADRRALVEERLHQLDAALVDQRGFEERVRSEIERWANPILGSVKSLAARLNNILDYDGYLVLELGYKTGTEWSISHDYMMQTTTYLFCQFFCWSQLLDERLQFDLFRSQNEKDSFRSAVRAVGEPLGVFPLPGGEQLPSGDQQIFSGQQRAAGEALIVGSGAESACMRLADFLIRWEEDDFQKRFRPIVALLNDLQPNTKRWLRLQRSLEALQTLEQACNATLTVRQK